MPLDDQSRPLAPAQAIQCTIPTRTADLLGITDAAYAHDAGGEQTAIVVTADRAVAILDEVRRRGEQETRANELLGYAAAAKNLIAAIGDALSRR